MQELLAIPDRDRTDAQWDELVELEVQFAPGNRLDANGRRDAPVKNFSGPGQPRRQGQKPKHFAGQGKPRRKPFVK